MTARKTGKNKPKVEKLELNRETVQDLTEREAERVAGGKRQKTGLPPLGNCLPNSRYCPMDTAKCPVGSQYCGPTGIGPSCVLCPTRDHLC